MNKTLFVLKNQLPLNFKQLYRVVLNGNNVKIGKGKNVTELVLDDKQPMLSQLCKKLKWELEHCELIESVFVDNEYCPRVYRPVFGDSIVGDKRVEHTHIAPPSSIVNINESLVQLLSLIEALKEIFTVISPDKNNLKVHGHKIRNLLILASTEAETQFKGVLRENGYKGSRLSTKDYVKTLGALRLEDYSLKLSLYPQLGEYSPFSNWEAEKPTKSLKWYDSYNSVKHDRESNFSSAQLDYAIDAVSACAVLLRAQYGALQQWKDHIGNFYQFTSTPKWDQFAGYTKLGYSDTDWKPIKYPF